MFLYQNVIFTVFTKYCLKTDMHMSFYTVNYFRRSGAKLSIHYYMIAFIIV